MRLLLFLLSISIDLIHAAPIHDYNHHLRRSLRRTGTASTVQAIPHRGLESEPLVPREAAMHRLDERSSPQNQPDLLTSRVGVQDQPPLGHPFRALQFKSLFQETDIEQIRNLRPSARRLAQKYDRKLKKSINAINRDRNETPEQRALTEERYNERRSGFVKTVQRQHDQVPFGNLPNKIGAALGVPETRRFFREIANELGHQRRKRLSSGSGLVPI